MKTNIKTFCLLFLLLNLTLSCAGQQKSENTQSDKFSKTYSKQAYLEDIDELSKTLTDNHPRPYEFIPKEKFWRNVEEKKKRITDSTTYSEFLWYASSIVASIGCGHTGLGYFNQEDKILPVGLRFPVEARLIDSRLYVSDPLVNSDELSVGGEILSINGKSINEIKTGIYKHISSDGYNEGFPKEIFNAYFTAIVAYYFNFPNRYEIVVKNRKNPIRLRQLKKQYKYKPRVNPKDKCQDKLCLEIMANKGIAKLTVRSFAYYGDRFDIFKTFVDKSLKEIQSEKIENLIIDLRLNSGGSDTAGSYLLEHIANRPFIYFAEESTGSYERKQETKPSKHGFQGGTYILMDGNGTSTTGHFLSLVKSNNFATLIGEEAGATYTVNDNSRSFKLTNTGISYRVARNTFFTTAKNLPKNKGVLPDHHLSQKITDFVNGTDTFLEYTIALILKNKDN